jgi:hypothetical protein
MNDNRKDPTTPAVTRRIPVVTWLNVVAEGLNEPRNKMEEAAVNCAAAALQTDDAWERLALLAAAGRYARGARCARRDPAK